MVDSSPDPPDGYTEPEEYELLLEKSKPILNFMIVVLCVTYIIMARYLGVRFFPEIQVSSLSDFFSILIALLVSISGALYLHESAHYIMTDYVGYEPEFVWPNQVRYGVDILHTKPTVSCLLAPQLLSPIYIVSIYVGVSPGLEAIVNVALLVNLIGGTLDVAWAIRRLTWPNGTVFINGENKGYVSYPKDD